MSGHPSNLITTVETKQEHHAEYSMGLDVPLQAEQQYRTNSKCEKDKILSYVNNSTSKRNTKGFTVL